MRAACAICYDLFEDNVKTGAAPCGHVYHFKCLKAWIQNSNTCPQCRSFVTESNILKLYFHIVPSAKSSSAIENEVTTMKTEILFKDFRLLQCENEKREIDLRCRLAAKKLSKLEGRAKLHKYQLANLGSKLKSLAELNGTIRLLKRKNENFSRELRHSNNFQLLLYGSAKSTQDILNVCGMGPEGSQVLATYCTGLRQELTKAIKLKDDMKEKYELDFERAKQNINKLQEKVSHLENENSRLSTQIFFMGNAIDEVTEDFDVTNRLSHATAISEASNNHHFLRSSKAVQVEH